MPLTIQDSADYENLVSDIQMHLAKIESARPSFLRVAENLAIIRDRKLYLAEFTSLEAFCETRLGLTRQWVSQQIKSANLMEALPENSMSTFVDKTKTTGGLKESHARALAAVPEPDRPAVIDHAASKPEPMTAASLKASARVVASEKSAPVLKDRTGWPIPEQRFEIFRRGEHVKQYLDKLSEIRGFVRRVGEAKKDLLFIECQPQEILMACDEIFQALKRSVPFAVCPDCQGVKADACLTCRGRGAISEFMWNTTIPEELKEIRRRALEDQ